MSENLAFAENDPNAAERKKLLEEACAIYQFTHEFGFALSSTFRPEDKAGGKWSLQVLMAMYRSRSNLEKYLETSGKKFSNPLPRKELLEKVAMLRKLDMPAIVNYYRPDLGVMLPSGRCNSLDDYKALFAKHKLPEIAQDVELEVQFGEMFLQGANPTVFRRLNGLPKNFPVPENILSTLADFPGDSLTAAFREGRVFWADYSEISQLKNGEHPQGHKYLSRPMALLVRPRDKNQFLCVAIQCDQDPSKHPIFTPLDNAGWKIAKLFVRVAHGIHHELIAHLGNTHLLVEPIVVATYRYLSIRHPLHHLLKPHFEGTLPINSSAVKLLIPPGRPVERQIGATSESIYAQIATSRLSHDFKEASLPFELSRRDVLQTDGLSYPYRDDGMRVWNAISRWVDGYVRRYYKSDGDVQRDSELAMWSHQISTVGKIKNFTESGSISSIRELIDTTTAIIWTASAQHACLNFAQKTDMMYLPLSPFAAYRDTPLTKELSEQDYIDTLPPLDVALVAVQTFYFLGSIYSTRLGEYDAFSGRDRKYFKDDAVDQLQKRFKDELASAEIEIKGSNAKRRRPYIHLLPSNIPGSVNI